LTSPELAERVDKRTVAVLALGAIEQHGPHLPLDTDTCIAGDLLAGALARVSPALDVLALPTLPIGASDEHATFSGTLTLNARCLADTLESIGESVARAGIRRLVWVNGHGGNRASMDTAALALRQRLGLLVVKCSYPKLGMPDGVAGVNDLARGFHGGWLETALMRHLAPDRVRNAALSDFTARYIDADRDALVSPEGPASFGWLAEDLNAEGVIGNAASATAEDGARLAAFFAERIARVIEETAALQWPPAVETR
jgi:creatinine amidohydrolase